MMLQSVTYTSIVEIFSRFYMPHGITIDNDNNLWLIDVAAHQVGESGIIYCKKSKET